MEQTPDLRAEMIALELANAGALDLDGAFFVPRGLLRRAVTRDVESLETACLPGESAPVRQFVLNREGFYEALPEAMLHARHERRRDDTSGDIVLRFRQLEREKAEARAFFLPFEQSFFRLRTELERWESLNCPGWLGGGKQTALAAFWNLPAWMTERQTLLACYLLPCLHRIVGQTPLVAAVFEAMIGGRVVIEAIEPAPVACGLALPPLGAMHLGADAILGERVDEGLPGLRLRLLGWPAQRVAGYFRGGNDALLIDWLCGFLLPAGMDITIEIEAAEEDRCFCLDTDSSHSLLGYTTTF